MKSGIGLLRAGQAVFWHGSFTCTAVTASTRHYFRHAQCRCLAATGAFLIGNRLDDLEVHLGMRFDAGDFAGNLGPMLVFTDITLRSAAGGSSLRLVIGTNRVRCGKPPSICPPTAADSSPMFDPAVRIQSPPTHLCILMQAA